MISEEIIKKTEEFVYSQTKEFFTPSIFHLTLSNGKGQELAEKLGADKNVVSLGTLLMDCMLGTALKEGRLEAHVEMSEQKTKEFLSQFSQIDDSEMKNILHCVKEHHGVENFYSLESEICCNADCYRFISIKGVLGGIKNFRDMDIEDMVTLFSKKADEKWNALSLDVCKNELEPQYTTLKKLFKNFK